MPHSITCPSGLRGDVRGLKTKEANILADSSTARKGTVFDSILKACWVETTDPGLYVLEKDGSLDWSKVLVCDRLYSLVQIRVATYGPLYAFSFQCSSQGCREKIDWEVNLNDDIKVKAMPKSSRDQLAIANRFPAVMPSTQRKVFFKLTTGADEVKAGQLKNQRRDKVMTLALNTRVLEVDGVHMNDKMRWLDDLVMPDAIALVDAMDEADGGIETDLEVECPHCGTIQPVSLPFGREFYMPSKKPKPTSTEEETAAES